MNGLERMYFQRYNCVTEQFVDPVKAWKIAGPPNPGEGVIMFKARDRPGSNGFARQ